MKAAIAGVVALVALTTSNCTGDQHTHAKVCVNDLRGRTDGDAYHATRLADADCDGGTKGARWDYFGEDAQIVAVGKIQDLDGSSWSIGPKVKSVTIPASGGTAHDQIGKK